MKRYIEKHQAADLGFKIKPWFKIDIDKSGEIFLPTKIDLTGYEIQIKRGSKVLKRVVIE